MFDQIPESEGLSSELRAHRRNGWRALAASIVFGLVTGAPIAAATEGCDPASRRGAIEMLLKATEVACTIAHAQLSEDEIAQACAISKEMTPAIRQIVASHKAGLQRAGVGVRGDGGSE